MPRKSSPAIDAVKARRLPALARAAQNPQLLRDRDNNRATALHLAAQLDWPEGLELLVQAGADLNAVDCFGTTALMRSAVHQNPASLRLLLGAGADLRPLNASGLDAASIAARRGMISNLRELLARGAALDTFDRDGCCSLAWALLHRDNGLAFELAILGAPLHSPLLDRLASHGHKSGDDPRADLAFLKILPLGVRITLGGTESLLHACAALLRLRERKALGDGADFVSSSNGFAENHRLRL